MTGIPAGGPGLAPESRTGAWLIFGLALLLALAPVLSTGIWAGADYPNHLARMAILMREGTADPHPFYLVRWGLYPNLAMDLLVPPLGRVLGAEAATRLFLLTSALLVVSGAMALGQAASRRPLPSGIAALLLLYSLPFALGFLNFEFGLGLALWAMAGWIALASRPWPFRFALHAVAVAGLGASHLMALGFYGFTIGLIELRAAFAGRSLGRTAWTFAWMAAPALALAALLAWRGGPVGGAGTLWNLPYKIAWLIGLDGFDIRVSGLCAGALALLLYALGREGRLRLVGPGPLLAAGYAALFLAMPFRLLDTAYADARVAVAAGLVLPAFLTIDLADARWRRGTLGTLWAVGLVLLGSVLWTQREAGRDLREIVASFPALGSRARVLVAASRDAPVYEDPLHHVPTLAAARADAFVPTLFSYPGKQPVVPVPSLARLDSDNDTALPLAILRAIAAGGPAPEAARYAADWPRDFDVLYVVGPPVPDLLPGLLQPIASARAFTLYRIGGGSQARPSAPRP